MANSRRALAPARDLTEPPDAPSAPFWICAGPVPTPASGEPVIGRPDQSCGAHESPLELGGPAARLGGGSAPLGWAPPRRTRTPRSSSGRDCIDEVQQRIEQVHGRGPQTPAGRGRIRNFTSHTLNCTGWAVPEAQVSYASWILGLVQPHSARERNGILGGPAARGDTLLDEVQRSLGQRAGALSGPDRALRRDQPHAVRARRAQHRPGADRALAHHPGARQQGRFVASTNRPTRRISRCSPATIRRCAGSMDGGPCRP